MKKPYITILVIAILCTGGLLAIFFIKQTNSKNSNILDATSTLPVTIFDAKTKIPGTSVFIGYPKKGFYNLGIKTVIKTDAGGNKEFPDVLVLDKTDYDPKKK